jgi:acyl-coenzyme A synthetase/AMP-(fatty) acid ligase
MTQERFHTIPSISLNRLYRTGDKGKYLSDGNIMFLGRNETQIKIDGHRIEIPAIEYIINQHPKVKQCIITATYTAEKKMSLQCYLLLSDSSIKHREIMHHLKGYLSSSLPSIRFYEIESIVLTFNRNAINVNLAKNAKHQQNRY